MGTNTQMSSVATAERQKSAAEAGLSSGGFGHFRLIDVIDDMCAGKEVFFRLVHVAEDIMTRDIKMLTLDDTVETCHKLMTDNQIRHVCVMDPPSEEGQKPVFVGIVSGRDVDRVLSPFVGKIGEQDTDKKALRLLLTQILTRNPKSATPDTPMPELIAIMVDNHVDMVPILNQGELEGVVTSTDIIKIFARLEKIRQLCDKAQTGRKRTRLVDLTDSGSGNIETLFSSSVQTVQDIMTEELVCLQEQDSIGKAIETMQKYEFRHLFIVSSQKTLTGLISDRDILRYLSFPDGKNQSKSEGFRSRLFAVDPNEQSLKEPITHIMKTEIEHILPSCPFNNAVKILYEKRISCLPVVDENKALLGIVTVSDMIRSLLATYRLAKQTA